MQDTGCLGLVHWDKPREMVWGGRWEVAGVLPRRIQGIRRVNSIGEEKTYLFRNIKEIKKK